MKKLNKNNAIKCNVESCLNNNCKTGTCILKNIEISCNCPKDKCNCVDETICKSFNKRK